ncbi:MAG: peptide chain release factor N(5)-glutamine methyltransferase [Myxococcales bacterium]|nr:peptide chain release factor N(5)-glutamine methyltransferase [Myxococcales bacterium]
MWTILSVLQWTEKRFGERGLPSPRLDAQVLLAHVLQKDRVYLYTHFDQPLAPEELAKYRGLIQRRLAGEPVAYLVGEKEFQSLTFAVDKRVLVPRPDTEATVDAALALLPLEARGRVVDVGTGSGAIALSIKKERPELEVLAVDVSSDAAAVARANAERLGFAVEVIEGDLLAPVAARAPFTLIVSNPPYIPSDDIAALAPEVRSEPMLALDGGEDGLDVVRRLVADAPSLLADGGALVLEVGAGQAAAVVALFAADGRYEPATTTKDLAGIDRAVSARKK